MRSTDFSDMKERLAATFDAVAVDFRNTLDDLKSRTESGLRADLNAVAEEVKLANELYTNQMADFQRNVDNMKTMMEDSHSARIKRLSERHNWLDRKLADLEDREILEPING